MQSEDFNKTLHISLLYLLQNFTEIFTGKMILPVVLPVNRWYGKFSKFTTLSVMILLPLSASRTKFCWQFNNETSFYVALGRGCGFPSFPTGFWGFHLHSLLSILIRGCWTNGCNQCSVINNKQNVGSASRINKLSVWFFQTCYTGNVLEGQGEGLRPPDFNRIWVRFIPRVS